MRLTRFLMRVVELGLAMEASPIRRVRLAATACGPVWRAVTRDRTLVGGIASRRLYVSFISANRERPPTDV